MDSCGLHKSVTEIGVVTLRAEFSRKSDKPFLIMFVHEHEKVIDIDRERTVVIE